MSMMDMILRPMDRGTSPLPTGPPIGRTGSWSARDPEGAHLPDAQRCTKTVYFDRMVAGIRSFFCATLITLVSPVSAGPASTTTDSLKVLLARSAPDTTRVNLCTRLLRSLIGSDPQQALAFGTAAVHLADSLHWDPGRRNARQALARAYWSSGDFKQAERLDMEVLHMMEHDAEPRAMATQLQYLGQDHLDGGNTAEAHKYLGRSLDLWRSINDSSAMANLLGLFSYLHELDGDLTASAKATHEALAIYEALDKSSGIAMSNANLAHTYQALGRLDEAMESYLRALRTYDARTASDSINLAIAHSELGDLYLRMGMPDKARTHFGNALEIGTRIQDQGQMALANRGFGAIAMQQKDYEHALPALLLAAEQFEASGFMRIDEARTHTDIGYCQAHLGDMEAAARTFAHVRAIADSMNSPLILAGYFKSLEFLDSLRGDWEGAYRNGHRYRMIQDSIAGRASQEQVVKAQLRYEEEKRELQRRAAQEQRDMHQRTIRNSIIAVLAGALVFLAVVYRQRNKINRARKRSDELLLNILPEEVAEELKLKGEAEAVHIDQVTVLFTDFKGFTAVSEVVTPRQLVHDLHECFSAFDRICEKHGIEKIKTIGDAYMAAGGLPTPNTTHATDAIKAALEMRDFIAEGKVRKVAAGLPYFEIRIGIHTGPVVAGIVGLKKFQYDIWGDTVNTASRMESSGEVGQVNISEATYRLVKDAKRVNGEWSIANGGDSGSTAHSPFTNSHSPAFTFTPRGKVQAKGKGEMEMYFVSRSLGEG